MPRGEPLSPALYAACGSNNVAEVRNLTTDLAPKVWPSVLTAATDAGAVEVASYCLEQGAGITYDTLYSVAWNPKSEPVYRYMVESGFTDVSYPRVFIDRGGDVLGLAADAGRHALVKFMLDRGATPNTTLESRGFKSTLVCAALNSDKEMVELLLDHGAILHGRGVLVAAAEKGKVDIVDLILEKGVDVDEKELKMCGDGEQRPATETALHKAAIHGHGEVIERLTQAGADVSIRNKDGKTSQDLARERGLDARILALLRVH